MILSLETAHQYFKARVGAGGGLSTQCLQEGMVFEQQTVVLGNREMTLRTRCLINIFLPIEAGHFVLLRNWTLSLRRRGNNSLSDPSLFCSQENLMTITSNQIPTLLFQSCFTHLKLLLFLKSNGDTISGLPSKANKRKTQTHNTKSYHFCLLNYV